VTSSVFTLGMPPDSYGKGLLIQANPGGYVPFQQTYTYPTYRVMSEKYGTGPFDLFMVLLNSNQDYMLCLERLYWMEAGNSNQTIQDGYIYVKRTTAYASVGTALGMSRLSTAYAAVSNMYAYDGGTTPSGETTLFSHTILFDGQQTQAGQLQQALFGATGLLHQDAPAHPIAINNGEYLSIGCVTPTQAAATVKRMTAVFTVRPAW